MVGEIGKIYDSKYDHLFYWQKRRIENVKSAHALTTNHGLWIMASISEFVLVLAGSRL